ncbi:DEAD/DEAH box helicase [Maridesulfovibrio frigidus]|uniref:DEAD/DEAH box helicase n=1 Tax=Maridesulfovibrio frigidus TaxID=340956 RepID=UPI0004E1CF9D|nr:ATP-binding domain-containing protein [Maridesulfovibrio frigidus]
MSLEIVRGNNRNPIAITALINCLKSDNISGTLYVGYPIIATAEDSHTIEAMLVSPQNGLIAFHFPDTQVSETVYDQQDSIVYVLESNLSKHESLRVRRRLAVEANVIAFFSKDVGIKSEDDYNIAHPDVFKETIARCIPIQDGYYKKVCSAIQRVTTIKPAKKRVNVKNANSKGAILKRLEREIANLDQWQKSAAIEVPEGPQRVRGLAGSGKTIVLALKAAYLHAQHPDWDIVVTFNTRSLIQQFTDLIERFSIEHSGDKPDWDKIKIMPAWGNFSSGGVYSAIATLYDLTPVNFATAKQKYGYSNAFSGVCNELLQYVKSSPSKEVYDAILIDEAQDLPSAFFQIIYYCTKDPKRIIWAYDELQNLNDSAMLPLDELFGTSQSGQQNIEVHNAEDEARQDITLPVCYRNSPWTLTLAHALGMGVYRSEGLVQLFDELNLFEDIGYKVHSGALSFESDVSLERKVSSYPGYITDLFDPRDIMQSKIFESKIEQYEWVASQINKNLKEDELDPDDILVIFANAVTAKNEYGIFYNSMLRYGIDTHLAGVSSSRDVFSYSGSVTASGIYRAKGNEAPMVYLVNGEWCSLGYEMIKRRNTLFTAITRSSAWVNICGVGPGMQEIQDEINAVVENNYRLSFHIPPREKLAELRIINRDRTSEEKKEVTVAQRNLHDVAKLVSQGLLDDKDPAIQQLLSLLNK